MHITARPRAVSKTTSAPSADSETSWLRVKQWAHAAASRAHPLALICALFATAFTATVVLRLIIFLAYLVIHPAL